MILLVCLAAAWAAIGCAAVGWWRHRRECSRYARAVHEVRGPLSAIALGIELGMRRGALGGERLGALALQVERAGAALQELERDETSRAQPRMGDVDLGRLTRACVEAFEPRASELGRTLSLAGVGGGPSVRGARARLTQALSNLLANALEHGAGEVCVQIAWAAGGSLVRIEVSDQGPGLPRPIQQLVGRGSRRGRHGHGLAIAAEAAAASGGRLLSAPCRRGACLVLELPAVRGELVQGRSPQRVG